MLCLCVFYLLIAFSFSLIHFPFTPFFPSSFSQSHYTNIGFFLLYQAFLFPSSNRNPLFHDVCKPKRWILSVMPFRPNYSPAVTDIPASQSKNNAQWRQQRIIVWPKLSIWQEMFFERTKSREMVFEEEEGKERR